MAEYHFPIPGGVDEEKIVMFVRRHWASFLGQFFLSVALLVLPAIVYILIRTLFSGFLTGNIFYFIVLVGSFYYLIALMVAFVGWLSFYYDIYIICVDEIIDITQQGFFGRKVSQQSILRVQDVNSNIQGIMATIFAYGDVLVETAGEQSQNYIIKSVHNPQEIAAKVMELHNTMVEKETRQGEMLSGEGTLRPNENFKTKPAQRFPSSSQEKSAPIEPEKPIQATTYQELLEKEKDQQASSSQPLVFPVENEEPKEEKDQGKVSHDDLDKGGQIEIK